MNTPFTNRSVILGKSARTICRRIAGSLAAKPPANQQPTTSCTPGQGNWDAVIRNARERGLGSKGYSASLRMTVREWEQYRSGELLPPRREPLPEETESRPER